MFRLASLTLAAVMALSLAACDSSEPDDDDDTLTPPSFNIASVRVTCDSGDDCIQFAARPTESVALTEVVISPPIGGNIRFNVNGDVVLRGEDVALQNAGEAYTRVSGTWSFTFIGARSPAVTNGNFNVVETVEVGAFAPEQPAD